MIVVPAPTVMVAPGVTVTVVPAAIVTLPESFVASVHVSVVPFKTPLPLPLPALPPLPDIASGALGAAVEQPAPAQKRNAAMHLFAIFGATCIGANLSAGCRKTSTGQWVELPAFCRHDMDPKGARLATNVLRSEGQGRRVSMGDPRGSAMRLEEFYA